MLSVVRIADCDPQISLYSRIIRGPHDCKGPVSQRTAMEYGISSTNGVLLFATCRARVSVRVSAGLVALVGRLGLSSKG